MTFRLPLLFANTSWILPSNFKHARGAVGRYLAGALSMFTPFGLKSSEPPRNYMNFDMSQVITLLVADKEQFFVSFLLQSLVLQNIILI